MTDWQPIESAPREDVWRGDLQDDCTLERYGMRAHVERMGRDDWWFAIGRGSFPNYVELYNTAENATHVPLRTGISARAAAECVMEALRACGQPLPEPPAC